VDLQRTCLVTGATGGIGTAIVSELARTGWRLFLTNHQDRLSGLARNESLRRSVAGWASADLSEEGSAARIAGLAQETLGVVDAIVHTAGLFPVDPVDATTENMVRRCLSVNLESFMVLCAELAPAMAERRWGRLVAIGSSSAYAGFARTSIYCASKHGLLGYCRALDDELRGKGVRVITVSPGSVKTGMGRLVEGQDYSTFLEPEDVARVTVDAMELDGSMVINELRLNRMVMR